MEELNAYHGCNAISRGVLKGPVWPGSEKLFQSENLSGCEMQTGPIIKITTSLSQLLKKMHLDRNRYAETRFTAIGARAIFQRVIFHLCQYHFSHIGMWII